MQIASTSNTGVRLCCGLRPVIPSLHDRSRPRSHLASSSSQSAPQPDNPFRGMSAVRAAASTSRVSAVSPGQGSFELPERSLMTTSITATTVEAFRTEMEQASGTGVDVLELRLDFISDFDTERDLLRIMKHSKLPYIVTYRPKWEWCAPCGPMQPCGVSMHGVTPWLCTCMAHSPVHLDALSGATLTATRRTDWRRSSLQPSWARHSLTSSSRQLQPSSPVSSEQPSSSLFPTGNTMPVG